MVGSTRRSVARRTVAVAVSVVALAGLVTGCRLTGIASIVVGAHHGCAVSATGELHCWGANGSGQLGDGTTTARLDPTLVPGVSGVAQVAVGSAHTCALLNDHSVTCWGANSLGELGNGSLFATSSPVPVNGITTATRIVAGSSHTCVLLADATVRCWGKNDVGQLGDGSVTNRATPVAPFGSLAGVTQFATGSEHTCAVLADGTARCWGYDWSGQLGDATTTLGRVTPVVVTGLTGATAIAAGESHTCAIVTGGAVRCWGANTIGQLGTGGPATNQTTPADVVGVTGADALTLGFTHSCVVVAGAARCWGDNDSGRFGVATPYSSDTPVVAGFPGLAALVAGGRSTCARFPDGSARCAGRNTEGQLGNGTAFLGSGPTLVGAADPLDDVVQVSAGDGQSCARTGAGTVSCWGQQSVLQLATSVPGLAGVTSMDSGGGHTCAVVAGAVWCWGENSYGELGDGTTIRRTTPAPVPGITDAVEVAVGGHSSCARLAGGSVQCWGDNDYGQLGNGTRTSSATPVVVSGITTATQIRVSGIDLGWLGRNGVACAVLGDGTARCWGNDLSGQLGDGNTGTVSSVPVAVAGLAGVAQLDIDNSHGCAVLTDASVRCWGDNTYGELGTGDTVASPVPVPVPGLTGVRSVAAGNGLSCSVLVDGTARCWGRNWLGALGDGTTTNRLTPVPVLGLTGASGISAAATHNDPHVCAVLATGQARCWGDNWFAQLGDGTAVARSAPVTVKTAVR